MVSDISAMCDREAAIAERPRNICAAQASCLKLEG